jgi:mannose-6-phosphate isomerase-like protein (cupin superfamily)
MSASVAGKPEIRPETTELGAITRTMLDAAGVAGRLVRRLVDVPRGAAYAGRAAPAGELWFVLSGTARLELDGPAGGSATAVQAGRYHGVRVPPGAWYRLTAAGPEPVELDVVALPAGAGPDDGGEPGGALVTNVEDCAAEMTGDRRFRVVFGPGRGCAAATQFVGEIPPGRAPVHSHAYDEVVLILAGEGVVHAGGTDHRLAPGTCVHLPPGLPHCLENTGVHTLVVLGVFHPGGSPAAKVQR